MQQKFPPTRIIRLSAGRVWPLAALAALAIIAAASAHARYDPSTPAQGAVMAGSPPRVEIVTVQVVKKIQLGEQITVTRNDSANTGGQRVDAGDTTVGDAGGKHVSVGLQPNLPAGRYVASFTNVADGDGDADHARFAFYVGNGPTDEQKALAAKLAITAQSAAAETATPTNRAGGLSHSNSANGIVIVAIAIAVVVMAIAVLAWLRMRRRSRI